MKQEYYWLWLLNIETMTYKKAEALLTHFGSAEAAWYASESDLRHVPNMTSDMVERIVKCRTEQSVEKIQEKLDEKHVNFIPIFDERYPENLKKIYDPPHALYVIGRLPEKGKLSISVIGARQCSEYGLLVAEKISRGLAKNDVVVVSGMARGIDGMAHKGALEEGGDTIAVLGCGVDICYPPENRGLMHDISEKGCVISEYPLGTPVSRYQFPERNRIISGLSHGVLVVEAEEKSGTNITVNQALEQGRLIFAVPGSIFNKKSSGTNLLIREGAIPIMSAEHILDEVGVLNSSLFVEKEPKKNNCEPTLAPEENLVYACISFEPVLADEIINRVQLPFGAIQLALTMLEIKGYVRKLPGQRYIRSI